MPISNVSDGVRASTAKAWTKAFTFWSQTGDSSHYAICDYFLAEAAFNIGEFDLAKSAFARVPALYLQLPSVAAFALAVQADRTVSNYQSMSSGLAFSKLLDNQSSTGPVEREIGRRLISEGQFVKALEYWFTVDPDGHPERELRLATAHYKLGQYLDALAHIERLDEGGRYADKTVLLKEKCMKGLERATRAYGREPDALGHPFIRDIREFLTHSDSLTLQQLATLAADWCGAIGAWDGFVVLLRRGMLAGDKTLLSQVPKSYSRDLVMFSKSRAMHSVSLAQFRDYAVQTLIAGSFVEAAEILAAQPLETAQDWA
jgi:tetratricopeptide (TPR) repeat protein